MWVGWGFLSRSSISTTPPTAHQSDEGSYVHYDTIDEVDEEAEGHHDESDELVEHHVDHGVCVCACVRV